MANRNREKFNLFRLIILTLVVLLTANCFLKVVHSSKDDADDDDAGTIKITSDDVEGPHPSQEELPVVKDEKIDNYATPSINENEDNGVYLYEHFDDSASFETRWIKSKNPKYNGEWKLNSGPDHSKLDSQLLLATKARHHAISTKFARKFDFSKVPKDKSLIVQYEVQYRENLDCGGSYVKLLRAPSENLSELTNETPYTIMFGPDKCGSDSKLHFIIQYKNPKTGEYEEKHWREASKTPNLFSIFNDRRHHYVKLILRADNSFDLFLDDQNVGSGNLLEHMEPPINPPEKIVDVQDTKPADWDDRVKIEDENAQKPDDWDEDAPKKIPDPSAQKPNDWIEDEPELIADPEAKKPDDWDAEIDGEWEAPLVPNPRCKGVSGCGEWRAPMVTNPAYKGNWRRPMIDNPNYKGVWQPKMIDNPDYYYDPNPFASLAPIDGIAFELWTMTDQIAFDNLLIADNLAISQLAESLTWHSKRQSQEDASATTTTQILKYFQQHPWLWGVLVLAIGVPVSLFIAFCCVGRQKSAAAAGSVAERKKLDKSLPDTIPTESQQADSQDQGDNILEDDENDEDDLDDEDLDEDMPGVLDEDDGDDEEHEVEEAEEVEEDKSVEPEDKGANDDGSGDQVRKTRSKGGKKKK